MDTKVKGTRVHFAGFSSDLKITTLLCRAHRRPRGRVGRAGAAPAKDTAQILDKLGHKHPPTTVRLAFALQPFGLLLIKLLEG